MGNGDPVRGRRQLLTSIISGCVLLFGLGLSDYFGKGSAALIPMLGRPLVLAALGRLAFDGRAWAPRLAGIWVGILALVAGGAGVAQLRTHPVSAGLVLVFAIAYAVVAVRLVASSHIQSFVRTRQQERAAASPPSNER